MDTGAIFITASEIRDQMHVGKERVYEWASREDDPLPLRYAADGPSKSGVAVVSELVEWWHRNSVPYSERVKKVP